MATATAKRTTKTSIELIREYEADADKHEADASQLRWEAARLIWEELDGGKSQAKLAGEIGKDRSHVRWMKGCWEWVLKYPRRERPPFNGIYNSPEVRGASATPAPKVPGQRQAPEEALPEGVLPEPRPAQGTTTPPPAPAPTPRDLVTEVFTSLDAMVAAVDAIRKERIPAAQRKLLGEAAAKAQPALTWLADQARRRA
jgi:hypothetical protein